MNQPELGDTERISFAVPPGDTTEGSMRPVIVASISGLR